MQLDNSTIVARATALGRAGVGVIRLSGSQSYKIALALVCGPSDAPKANDETLGAFKPRYSHLTRWLASDGLVIDEGLTIYFPAPNSFTGEDVIELQAHGGVVILDWLIQRCVELGARLARPGEFSERSFLNGKLDLAQAEAVASLIDASSREAVISAGRSLQGVFSRRIHEVVERVTAIRVHVEAAIDFVDEDLETDDISKITTGLSQVQQNLIDLMEATRSGVRLHEGVRIAIGGEPNAGKSSLLNALSHEDSAIVSNVPGTTRDIIKERLVLRGVPVEVLDTAGLRETNDPLELQGIERAKQALATADLLLWMFDANLKDFEGQKVELQRLFGESIGQTTVIFLANKIDLLNSKQLEVLMSLTACEGSGLIACSVTRNSGIENVIDSIMSQLGVVSGSEGHFIARRRHLEALRQALGFLDHSVSIIGVQPLELIAENLRLAQEVLGTITGQFTSDDLLGKIFSSFCVGK